MFSASISDRAHRGLRPFTFTGAAFLCLATLACGPEYSSVTALEYSRVTASEHPVTTPDAAALTIPSERRGGPGPRARSSDLLALPFFVRAESGRPIVASTPHPTPLFEAILGSPILAPDGRHVTWGEWKEAEGRIQVLCTRRGTHTVLHLAGLIPRGVYTIWNVVFQEPGFTGEFVVPGSIPAHAIGFGPAGPPSGERSRVRASRSGRAHISVTTPGGRLGSAGEIGHCALTDEFEWHVVGLYHIDEKTYGPVRGPDGSRAEHFAFVFKNDAAKSGGHGEEGAR